MPEFQVTDSFAYKDIHIKAFQIPNINRKLLQKDIVANQDFNELFKSTKVNLKNHLNKIFFPEYD